MQRCRPSSNSQRAWPSQLFIAVAHRMREHSTQHSVLLSRRPPRSLSAKAKASLKASDASERKLLIGHGPISGTLEMPAMVMSFRIAPDIDLASLALGDKVKFTLSRDANGLYVIDQIHGEK